MQHTSLSAEIVRTSNCFDRIYDQHCHTLYEVLFVLKGSISLNVEGEQILLKENTGIVLMPLKYHIVTGNNTAYHRLIICFDREFIPDQIYHVLTESLDNNCVFFSESLSRLFHKYADTLENDNSTIYAPLYEAIMTEALYCLAFENHTRAESVPSMRMKKVKRVISYVDRNISRKICLRDIATELYMSQSSLSHLFKEEMKISLKQYILQKKMIYAKALLNKGASPGAAAAACGYKSYPSFYKAYLKIVGTTPIKNVPENEQAVKEMI